MTDPLLTPKLVPGVDVSTWPYVKVARAATHVLTLQSAIQTWVASRPFRTVGALDSDGLRWALSVDVNQPPPLLEWGAVIGDAVHCLRSALDSVAWELAHFDAATPREPTKVYFPIVEDPAKWQDVSGTKLQSAPHWAYERIRLVQPMNRDASDRTHDGLSLLHYLDLLDKHRSNISISFATHEVEIDFAAKFEDDDAAARSGQGDLRIHDIELRQGAVVVEYITTERMVSTTGGFGLDVRLRLDTPTGRQDLFETLNGLVQYTQTILSVVYSGAVRD